jgi:TonB family protein
MPNDANVNDETVLVSVTVARDGTVISSRIITPSGNATVDRSVQAALDSVRSIAPFPDGMNEEQHTFQINFEPKTKKLTE